MFKFVMVVIQTILFLSSSYDTEQIVAWQVLIRGGNRFQAADIRFKPRMAALEAQKLPLSYVVPLSKSVFDTSFWVSNTKQARMWKKVETKFC